MLLGFIVVTRKPDGEAFSETEDTVLTEIARQIALALHNVQLDTALQASLDELQVRNEELQHSRARIVAAGDSERRKLERNLHDGAQQHLVALAVKLRLARDSVEDDPEDAVAMIDEIKADVQTAIAELRALAHGIYPPLLVSGGLREALPAAAGRAALPTTVEIDGVGRYGNDIEAAVYFCTLEALQNAGKHAGDGASATVNVAESDGELRFEIRDDGAGFEEKDASTATGSSTWPTGWARSVAPWKSSRLRVQEPRSRERFPSPGRTECYAGGLTPGVTPGQSGSPPSSQRRRSARGESSSLLT